MIGIKAIWLGLVIAATCSAVPALADNAITDCEDNPYFEFSLNPLYLSDDPYALVLGASLAFQSIVTSCPQDTPEADLQEALMRGQMGCPEDAQITCRNRRANSDYSSSDFMYRAFQAGSSDPLILHQMVAYCAQMSSKIDECRYKHDNLDCALSPHRESEMTMCQGNFVRDLSRVDPDNSHSWVLYALQSYTAHNRPHALEMLQQAVQRERYDLYFPQQALQFAGTAMEVLDRPEAEAFKISAGLAVKSLPSSSAYSMCMKEAPVKPIWAKTCLALGEQMEQHDRTRWTTLMGLALQSSILKLQGPSVQLNAVEKRREKRRAWRPDFDADMFELRSPSGELYARLFYQNMLEYGEEEASNMFLRAVADRSAEKSPSL